MQIGVALWKAVWIYLKKLKIKMPYDPAISPLRIYSKKPKILNGKDICTLVFIAMLFLIVKIEE